MRRVILETPYAGDMAANVDFARQCMRDCLMRREAPFASHLLYTQDGVLLDHEPVERELGFLAAAEWLAQSEATVVYLDRGISKGMRWGIQCALDAGRPVEYRWLKEPWTEIGGTGHLPSTP